MSNYIFDSTIMPGHVIFARGASDLRDSKFGVIVPWIFWDEKATKQAKERLAKYDAIYAPAWIMDNEGDWRVSFCQVGHFTPVANLLRNNIEDQKVLNICHCFTHRDGSRYYSEFFDWTLRFYRFIHGIKKIEEFPGCSDHFPLINHLLSWKKENQDMM